MHIQLKDQNGFSVAETLLVVFIVAVIASAGFLVWHGKKQTNNSGHKSQVITSSQLQPASTTPASSGVYANWKTYEWKAEGLSFKYPASWVTNNPQLSAQEQANQPAMTSSSPVAFLFAPQITTVKGFAGTAGLYALSTYSGSFSINAEKDTAANIEGSSAASDTIPGNTNTAEDESIVKIIPVTIPGHGPMSIVEESLYGYVTQLALTDAPVSLGITHSTSGDGYTSMSPDDSFQSKSDANDRISFAIGFFGEDKVNSPLNFSFISMQRNIFESQQDYQTALNILKSVTYN